MEARELAKTGPSRCLAGLVVGGVTVGLVAVDLPAAGAGDSLARMVAVVIGASREPAWLAASGRSSERVTRWRHGASVVGVE
jgi:hypothetical protein